MSRAGLGAGWTSARPAVADVWHAALGLAGRARSAVTAAAPLLLILVLGGVARAWLITQPQLVNEGDMRLFERWATGLAARGLAGFYESESFCDYPPLSVLLLQAVGKLAQQLGSAGGPDTWRMLLQLPASLADVCIALLLLLEGRRIAGYGAGVGAAALYLLNPAVIYDSAYWGQVDAVYTALLVAAYLGVTRAQWHGAGAAAAAALLAKFQAIALVPLLLFETYRLGGWRALRDVAVSALAVFALTMTPFMVSGTADDVLQRSYVQVVGQYHQLSRGAYNVWSLMGQPGASDTALPAQVATLAAGGTDWFPADTPLAWLTWRHLSLALYALAVGVVLSLYALRPGPRARYGAAGLLALAFFLFPTEMHERYAFPMLAFLALWSAGHPARERLYFLASALMLLNLAAILPPAPLEQWIGAGHLLAFAAVLLWLVWPGGTRRAGPPDDHGASGADLPPVPGRRRLIPLFQWTTAAALTAMAGAAILLVQAAGRAPVHAPSANVVYLDEITPRTARQGWGALAARTSVSGGMLRLGERVYLRGLGTHAPSRLEYDIPAGAETFRALVGVDAGAGRAGSVVASACVDGRPVFTSPVLLGGGASVDVAIPVQGGGRLTLRAHPTADGQRCDHVSWALARFE